MRIEPVFNLFGGLSLDEIPLFCTGPEATAIQALGLWGATVPLPDFLLRAFPNIRRPTLVVWGMQDKALLPIQLEGLDELIDDLSVVRLPNVGHFAPWEAPDAVADALRPFLAGEAAATAPGT